MFRKSAARSAESNKPGGVRKLFRRAFRRVAGFAFRSRLSLILTGVLVTALAAALVDGLIILSFNLGLSRKVASMIAAPAAGLATFIGTWTLNTAFVQIVAAFRGKEYTPPAFLGEEEKDETEDFSYAFPVKDATRGAHRASHGEDSLSPSGLILRNGGWICNCGAMNPFNVSTCRCGMRRPEPEEDGPADLAATAKEPVLRAAEPAPEDHGQPEAAPSAPKTMPPATGEGKAAGEMSSEPWFCLQPEDYLRIPWDMFGAAAIFLAPVWFIGGQLRPRPNITGGWALGMLIASLPGLIIASLGLRRVLRHRRLFREGEQIRARVISAKYRYIDGSRPVYRVTCVSGSARFTGPVRLSAEDPGLVGKNITVFVSPKNPKDYIIEGQTASYN